MAPKKRPAEGGEMTMQTRRAIHYSYSELDEDQGGCMTLLCWGEEREKGFGGERRKVRLEKRKREGS